MAAYPANIYIKLIQRMRNIMLKADTNAKTAPCTLIKKMCLHKKDWLLKMKKRLYVEKSQEKRRTFLNT